MDSHGLTPFGARWFDENWKTSTRKSKEWKKSRLLSMLFANRNYGPPGSKQQQLQRKLSHCSMKANAGNVD